MSFDDTPGSPNSDDDLERALHLIDDNAYNRKWLLSRADWINEIIRTATLRDRHYHMAVNTLMNVLPTMLTGREFKAWWDRLIELLLTAQNLRDSDLIARLTLALARLQLWACNPTHARVYLKQAETYLSGANQDTLLEAYASLIEAQVLSPTKNFDLDLLNQALELAARSENVEMKALIHLMIAATFLHRQDLERAGFHIERILERGDVIKDPNMLLRVLLMKEGLLRQKGDWAACASTLQRARVIFPMTLQNPRNYLALCYEEGAVAGELGRHQEAIERFQDALDHADGLEDSYEVGLCYIGLAVSNISLMQLDAAVEAIEEAHDLWQYIGNHYLVVHAMYTRGYIELLRGEDLVLARNLLVDAQDAAKDIEQHAAREQLERLIEEKLGRLGFPGAA